MSYHSEMGQDKRLNDELFHDRRGLTFVDVGAFDGVEFSNTLAFEKDYGWKGVCVEPHPERFQQLAANRPKSICVNAAAGSKSGTQRFLKISCEQFSQFDMLSCTVDAAHARRKIAHDNWRKQYGGDITEIEVPVLPLWQILLEHRIFTVDYLTIDVEGSEFEVLKGIEWQALHVNVIEFEVAYRDTGADLRETAEIYEYLESKGFRHGFDLAEGRDRVFINNQLKWSLR